MGGGTKVDGVPGALSMLEMTFGRSFELALRDLDGLSLAIAAVCG